MKVFLRSLLVRIITLVLIVSVSGCGSSGGKDSTIAGKWLIQWESVAGLESGSIPPCAGPAVPRQEIVTINVSGLANNDPIVVEFENGQSWAGRITNNNGSTLIAGKTIPLSCPGVTDPNRSEDLSTFVVWASDLSAEILTDVRSVRWVKCGPGECYTLTRGRGERID